MFMSHPDLSEKDGPDAMEKPSETSIFGIFLAVAITRRAEEQKAAA
jgi:hypothetical protein